MNRREFLASGAVVGAGIAVAGAGDKPAVAAPGASAPTSADPKFKLGLISYNLGATWDLPTFLKVCAAAGIEGAEFRTTHAHKVEPELTADGRADVKKRCADSGLTIVGLGSVCEFHSADPAVVKKHIDDCAKFAQLAADIGAKGVKVRPNGFPRGVEPAKTLEQIGKALAECGKHAGGLGVEIWLEVHGAGTQNPPNIRTIMDHCDSKAVGVCWNSNPTDLKDGSLADSFELLKKDIKHCHINELVSGYPYRDLFARLRGIGYDRWTMNEVGQAVAEAAAAKDPVQAIRFLKYYKGLWKELARG